jgi:hypothetical protein
VHVFESLPCREERHTVFFKIAFLESGMCACEDLAGAGFGNFADCVVVFWGGFVGHAEFELRIGEPNFDVVGFLEETFV